nr:unnamed protein product [Spirometra erinaceieuropaei]
MEALVKSAIQQFCEEYDILQDFQHGFRRGRSCLSNLLACLNILTGALEEGFEVDVVYIDFRKAFDTVAHQRLLHKLSAIGISSETGFNPSALQSFEDTPIIETVQFTEGMVLTELLRPKESKSPGFDEIPAKILKELTGELSKPLSMLFHTSFETGYLPPDWKSAWITPLYNGGSRVSANNYRPVSLTSICCKIMEKIIKQQLMQFLEQNHLLSDSQHGFRKGRSCVTNLLYCLEHWTRAVDRGDMVHAIYIDFKKAFDSVPHHRLLYKLSRAGVRGKLLMWIRSFLIGRCQAVHVGDQQSAEVAVKSGVPQGSVLGPTLFLVYANDCANELNCDVAMFADDIKIWSTIRSEVDEARLQTSLDHLEQWSKDWLLPFNVNKCTFLRVGRTSSPNHPVYRLTGKPLQEVDAQKDLGVWITTSLKPSLQCSKVAKSAMSMLYLVKRAFSSFDEDCFAKVFQTFVRPHLEFAIQAWRPWTAKDLGILEKVQRRATKLVSGQWSLPYETRLANLDIFPLSYRQLRGDLIQTFRIVRNQGCCLAFGDFFELATTTNLRGHPLKLRVAGARLDTRKFFFSNRVVASWNALPEDVVMSGSAEILRLNAVSDRQRYHQLIKEESLGDRKPSELLRRMRTLLGDMQVDEKLVKEMFLERLPADVQTILASGSQDLTLSHLAEMADRMIEVQRFQPPSVAQISTSSSTVNEHLLQQMSAMANEIVTLKLQLARITCSCSPSCHRSRSRPRTANLCWYHANVLPLVHLNRNRETSLPENRRERFLWLSQLWSHLLCLRECDSQALPGGHPSPDQRGSPHSS